MRSLCVIPARGGSKRVARKNVREFAGKPMLAWALTAARDSGVFDHVHVSTDDDEISDVAAAFGAEPTFRRAPELADDYTPIRDVVRQDLERFMALGQVFDTVVLVYATAALIEAADILAAMGEFERDRQTPLLAVAPAQTPFERFLAIEKGVLRPVLAADRFASRTQDLTTVYRDAGAVAIYSVETLLADIDGASVMAFRPFVLPAYKAVDIDTEDDWHHAEIIRAGLAALGG